MIILDNVEIVELLIQNGANVNSSESSEDNLSSFYGFGEMKSPLIEAAINGMQCVNWRSLIDFCQWKQKFWPDNDF